MPWNCTTTCLNTVTEDWLKKKGTFWTFLQAYSLIRRNQVIEMPITNNCLRPNTWQHKGIAGLYTRRNKWNNHCWCLLNWTKQNNDGKRFFKKSTTRHKQQHDSIHHNYGIKTNLKDCQNILVKDMYHISSFCINIHAYIK